MDPPSENDLMVKEISWSVGDLVVYRKSKVSSSPGPRAKGVSPSSGGNFCNYTVDKYWIVKELLPAGNLLVQTLRGKEHTLSVDDYSLRKPYLWERWFLRRRFRELSESLKPNT